LAQGLFGKFSLGDVPVRAAIADQLTLRIQYRQTVRLKIAISFMFVFPSQDQTGPASLFTDPLLEQFFKLSTVFGLNKSEDIRAQNFLRLVAENVLDGRIRVGMISLEIDRPDPFVGCLYDRTEFFFTVLERFLSAFARADITGDAL